MAGTQSSACCTPSLLADMDQLTTSVLHRLIDVVPTRELGAVRCYGSNLSKTVWQVNAGKKPEAEIQIMRTLDRICMDTFCLQ